MPDSFLRASRILFFVSPVPHGLGGPLPAPLDSLGSPLDLILLVLGCFLLAGLFALFCHCSHSQNHYHMYLDQDLSKDQNIVEADEFCRYPVMVFGMVQGEAAYCNIVVVGIEKF
jgi:hypothetical protein